MGAREELLVAARSLGDRGMAVFSPAQLIAEVRSLGTIYPDTTLRTFIVSLMCANSPNHHAVQYRDFERVARGLYRLYSTERSVVDWQPPLPDALVAVALKSVENLEVDDPWFWEGNVQALVVSYLAAAGWRIRRVANTASSEHGVDIEADGPHGRLLIEVKGYPGSTYARGERKGEAKTTPAAGQARTYFSNALLSAMLMRSEAPDSRIVLAFPDVLTYSNLGGRVAGPLVAAGIEVWLVGEDGAVSIISPPAL